MIPVLALLLAAAPATQATRPKPAPRAPAVPAGKVRLPPLSYTVERSGPATGAHPTRSDTVLVRYRLTLLDGREVDASPADGPPARFPLGRLIPAWQVMIPLMRPGDVWTFFVPPEYGYGPVAKGDDLPANSFLVFRVELVGIEAGE